MLPTTGFIYSYCAVDGGGVPGDLVGYPKSISRFQFSPSASSILVGTFSSIEIDWRRARERELATFDENRGAVGMLNPMRDKNEGTYRGEGTTPVTTACPEDR